MRDMMQEAVLLQKSQPFYIASKGQAGGRPASNLNWQKRIVETKKSSRSFSDMLNESMSRIAL